MNGADETPEAEEEDINLSILVGLWEIRADIDKLIEIAKRGKE